MQDPEDTLGVLLSDMPAAIKKVDTDKSWAPYNKKLNALWLSKATCEAEAKCNKATTDADVTMACLADPSKPKVVAPAKGTAGATCNSTGTDTGCNEGLQCGKV